jgi:cytochrome oxidase assembly protein ShyY1
VLPEKDKIYLELKDPEVSLFVPLPLPQMTAGPHLGYVGQWILIAIFAIAVYVIALRNLPKN